MFNRSLFFALTFFVLAGAAAPLQAQPHERTVRDTVALTPGSVSIDNEEGSITVTTWDRDAVAYEARIVSEQAPEIVENTLIEAETFNQQLSLVSDFDDLEARWSFGPEIYGYGVAHPDVHYTLTLPRTAALTVDDTESTIEITGLAAALQLETLDSEVRVREHRGPVRVDANEGTVVLTDVQGDLKVDTHEGTVRATGLRGRLMLDTHEGEADIAIDSLAAVNVDTHEGAVALTVPRDAGFDLSTDLGEDARFEGRIDAALPGAEDEFDEEDEDDDHNGVVRDGGPLVRLSSHEGEIVLQTP
jgi:DUF4097 and DUF4098 domain-containing protein YvlB